MRRLRCVVVLALALTGCSSRAAPPAGDSPRVATPGVVHAPATPAAVVVPPPDPREAVLSRTVLDLLEHEHLLRKQIDDEVSRAAFTTYLESLDGSKMFLLRADRDALARYADKIDDELRSGSLSLAHDGAKIFAARVAVVDKVVSTLLAAPFDHTDEEWLELDPKKIEPATTEDELRDRWRKRLELEVLERVAAMEARLEPAKPSDAKDKADEDKAAIPLAQIPTTPDAREVKARADLTKSYAARFARLRTPGVLDAAADLVNAVASSLDPHTTYLPPAEKANFDIHMTGALEGIGAVLRERDHYIEVVELVPGGASWRQGTLAAGDLITSVAQEGQEPVDVADMRIDQVVKMVRGPKGTVVRLHVENAAGVQETIAITRDIVVVEETYARGAVLSRPGKPTYGYIHLPSFYGGKNTGQRTAAGDVHRLLAEMKTRKVAGVVLDIRSNGGGLLGDAIEMTGDLIDTGPVVQVQDSRGHHETLSDDKKGLTYDGPLIVMIDKFSASASEIVAGALQDYGRAVIVGTTTHGKGTVQTLADLDQATKGKIELGVLKITIQQFFRVSGSSTQREGVSPDVVLPDPAGYVDTGERTLDHAIAWSQIDPAPHDKWPSTWKSAVLVQRSAARVGKQPVLSKVATTTQLLRIRRDDTRVPLARAAWDARRKELKVALDAASPNLKKAPAKFTVKLVEDPNAAAPAPAARPGGKTDDRIAKWSENLARDPWVEETLNILGDMTK